LPPECALRIRGHSLSLCPRSPIPALLNKAAMDPALASRLAQQRAKAEGNDAVLDIGSTIRAEMRLDPDLERRLARQRAKEAETWSGMGAGGLGRPIEQPQKPQQRKEPVMKKADPLLEKLLLRQLIKCGEGNDSAINGTSSLRKGLLTSPRRRSRSPSSPHTKPKGLMGATPPARHMSPESSKEKAGGVIGSTAVEGHRQQPVEEMQCLRDEVEEEVVHRPGLLKRIGSLLSRCCRIF